MNEDWNEMMAYAPLLEDEVDTDYQKAEDFTESELAMAEEPGLTMPCDTEDYFAATESFEMTVTCKTEDARCANEEEEEFTDESYNAEAYDDYQTMPEIPVDIYSDEEY